MAIQRQETFTFQEVGNGYMVVTQEVRVLVTEKEFNDKPIASLFQSNQLDPRKKAISIKNVVQTALILMRTVAGFTLFRSIFVSIQKLLQGLFKEIIEFILELLDSVR